MCAKLILTFSEKDSKSSLASIARTQTQSCLPTFNSISTTSASRGRERPAVDDHPT